MRRATIVSLLLGILVSSCAAPKFDLRPRFLSGEVRVYRLTADATVSIAAGRAATSERSLLVATTTLRVEATSASGTTLTLTVSPRSLTRDGKASSLPAPQQIQIDVGPDGLVRQVTTVGSQPAPVASTDVEDLVPLIGPPAPPGRAHLGDRWTPSRPQPTPSQSGSPAASASATPTPSSTSTPVDEVRFAALRVIEDYDCAVIAVSARRPVVRDRVIAGRALRLTGIEFAASEIAFAFREGLPVSVRSDSEARLAISGFAAGSGTVTVATKTSILLQRRTAPGLR